MSVVAHGLLCIMVSALCCILFTNTARIMARKSVRHLVRHTVRHTVRYTMDGV